MAPRPWSWSLLFLLSMPLAAQAQGLPTEWEVRDLADSLARQMDQLAPALARFDTANWTGAPVAYAEQRDIAVKEAGYAAAAARELVAKPLSLGKGFELQLRLLSIEPLVASLAVGARTYQEADQPTEPQDLLAAAAPQQSKLRTYLIDLAVSKDQELAAVDAEAQRCRAIMLRTPAAVPVSKPSSAPQPNNHTNRKTTKK